MGAVLDLIASRFREQADVISTAPGHTALVLESPHSGTVYPADFDYIVDLAALRTAEDTHVEKLWGPSARARGAAWVEAHFPRSYLDANRNTTEIDTAMFTAPWPGPVSDEPAVRSKLRLGKGLIWKCMDDGQPLYRRLLTVEEVQARIERYWQPYHLAVAAAIDAAHARHGYSIHIDCHSMPSVAASHATDFPGLHHSDFVIGDRDGSTASPALSAMVCHFLRARGYSVDYNHPYKGVELVRRNGRPQEHRHSIQIEINRKLYMDETTLEMGPGFASLQADLDALVDMLLRVDARALHARPAGLTA